MVEELKVIQDLKELKDLLEELELEDHKEPRVLVEILDQEEFKDIKDQTDRKDLKEQRVLQVVLDLKVIKVALGNQHRQEDLKDILEPQVVLVLELEDLKDIKVLVPLEVTKD